MRVCTEATDIPRRSASSRNGVREFARRTRISWRSVWSMRGGTGGAGVKAHRHPGRVEPQPGEATAEERPPQPDRLSSNHGVIVQASIRR